METQEKVLVKKLYDFWGNDKVVLAVIKAIDEINGSDDCTPAVLIIDHYLDGECETFIGSGDKHGNNTFDEAEKSSVEEKRSEAENYDWHKEELLRRLFGNLLSVSSFHTKADLNYLVTI